MDHIKQPEPADYKTIAIINDEHNIFLVQHRQTKKIFIKKILEVYNLSIYEYLQSCHITGIPQIIGLYEEHGRLVLIEEYISGISLQDKIDFCELTESHIVLYMEELCDILSTLHTQNPPIVHRDIKPSNILITHYNHVVLIDFNAAKYLTDKNSPDTVLLGTKGYAAPEQYGFGSSTPQTDIYAAGILLRELTAPFPELEKQYAPVIETCTKMNPSERFRSVMELKAALSRFYNKPTIQVTSNHVLSPTNRKSFAPPGFRSRKPWKMFVATVSYLLIFELSLTLEVENVSGIPLWTERIFCLFMMLSVVFSCFNYLDLQKLIPLCQNKNRLVRYAGILLQNIITIFTLFMMMFLIESVF